MLNSVSAHAEMCRPDLMESIGSQKINTRDLRNGSLRHVLPIAGIITFIFALLPGAGSSVCSKALIRFASELRDEHQAEANIVVAVVGRVVVAVSRPAVLRIVVPTATTKNTVRTLDRCPYSFMQKKHRSCNTHSFEKQCFLHTP